MLGDDSTRSQAGKVAVQGQTQIFREQLLRFFPVLFCCSWNNRAVLPCGGTRLCDYQEVASPCSILVCETQLLVPLLFLLMVVLILPQGELFKEDFCQQQQQQNVYCVNSWATSEYLCVETALRDKDEEAEGRVVSFVMLTCNSQGLSNRTRYILTEELSLETEHKAPKRESNIWKLCWSR